jgi:hypothetical protein
MRRAEALRLDALEEKIAADSLRQLSVEPPANRRYREPSSGRFYTATELEMISDGGTSVVVLAPKPEGLDA